MKIIDAHMHLCEIVAGYCRRGELRSIGNGQVQWANGDVMDLFPTKYSETNFLAEAALQVFDENGVEAGLILQGSMYGFQNRYIEQVVKKYPDRFRGACTTDPFAKNAVETLEHLMKWTSIVKFEVSSGGGLMGVHDDFALDGEKMQAMYRVINENNGTVVIDFGDYTMASYQPQAMANVAKQYPNMKITICHLTAPIPEHLDKVRSALEILRADNVWFDIAALPKIANEPYPYPTAVESLKLAKEVVGAKKIMFGTDMPFAMMRDSYHDMIRYIPESGVFSDSELEDVFYHNAKALYFGK